MGVHEKMTELADAVRNLHGGTELLTLDAMIQNIRDLGTSDIISTAAGHPVYITDCMTRKLHGLTVYGKTALSGTPAPNAPAVLESAGADGSILVSVDTQTLTVSTPNGLPGIKIGEMASVGGNYTDRNGDAWVCDEIDFARGKYVRRIGIQIFDGSGDEGWKTWAISGGTRHRVQTDLLSTTILKSSATSDYPNILSSIFVSTCAGSPGIWAGATGITVDTLGNIYCYTDLYNTQDVSLWTSYLAAQPMTVVYQLAVPVETDLTAEQLAAYAALHTNYPHTLIHNDAEAWMSVQYAADPKTYIDNKFTQVASAIVSNT